MGLLDFLFDKEKSAERKLQKHEEKLTNMYVQAPERQWVVQELAQIGTTEAAAILLKRFTENNPNTTLDIEEKELVYDTLVRMSRNAEVDVVGEVKRFVLEAEVKINWPMKVLADLLPRDAYVAFLVEVLKTCDTSYQRTVEKKQELMLQAMDHKSPELAEQIGRFLSDNNETIRFLAFDAAFVQDDYDKFNEAFFARYLEEDSGRIVEKIHKALSDHRDLLVPEELAEAVDAQLPDGLGLHKNGYVYRRRR